VIDRPTRIVVVEDEESDLTFITKAFDRGKLDHQVVACKNAGELLAHLSQCHADGIAPDLVLLDMSLPGLTGLEALGQIRNGDQFPELIVIVLTSSSYRREVTSAYAAGANAFVTKPVRLAALDTLVELIEDFWFGAAQLPYSS